VPTVVATGGVSAAGERPCGARRRAAVGHA
jgi:hypothetical protein